MANIVVVDDNEIVCKVLATSIECIGHTPTPFLCAREALDYIRGATDISLLMTDMLMPIMNGRDLIMAVRNDLELTTLPIILYSGGWKDVDFPDVSSFDPIQILHKPIRLPILTEAIETMLNLTC